MKIFIYILPQRCLLAGASPRIQVHRPAMSSCWLVVSLSSFFFYLYLLISIFALQLFIGPLFCFLMVFHCFRLVPMFAALGLGLDQESLTSNVLPSLQYEFFSTSFFEVGYFFIPHYRQTCGYTTITTEPKDATFASTYVNILLLLYSSFYFVGLDCKVTRKICFNKNAMKKYAGNFSDFVADLPFVEAKLKLKSSRQLLFRLKWFVSLPSSGGFMTFQGSLACRRRRCQSGICAKMFMIPFDRKLSDPYYGSYLWEGYVVGSDN